jgi:hypothetical protein
MMMRNVGLLLIAAGFIGGALSAVISVDTVQWIGFVPSLVGGVVGVVLVQISMRRAASDVGRIEADFQTLDERLRRIVDDVATLEREKTTLDVYDLPGRIDARLPEEIVAFADARKTIGTVWGATAYADVMSHFAAGERYLNRVWSTAADGYIDEAHASLTRSLEEFSLALGHFEAAKTANAGKTARPT